MSNTVLEDYECSCGFRMPVVRFECERRGRGHLKALYCPTCDGIRNMRKIDQEEVISNLYAKNKRI